VSDSPSGTEQVALTRTDNLEIVEAIRDGGIQCPDCRSDVSNTRGATAHANLHIDGWYCKFCNNLLPANCDASASAYVDGWTGLVVEFRDGGTRHVPVPERYVDTSTAQSTPQSEISTRNEGVDRP